MRIKLLLISLALCLSACGTKIEESPKEYTENYQYDVLYDDEYQEATLEQLEESVANDYNDTSKFKTFKKWKEINTDVVYLLSFKDRQFPVVKNDKVNYLYRDIYKKKDIFGTPFVQIGDTYKLIYAHSVYGASEDLMFTFISNYKGKDYWKDHKSFSLTDENSKKNYLIVALVWIDLNNDDYQGCLDPSIDKTLFVNFLKDKALIYIDDFTANDDFVSLITCDTASANARYLLIGKEV